MKKISTYFIPKTIRKISLHWYSGLNKKGKNIQLVCIIVINFRSQFDRVTVCPDIWYLVFSAQIFGISGWEVYLKRAWKRQDVSHIAYPLHPFHLAIPGCVLL